MDILLVIGPIIFVTIGIFLFIVPAISRAKRIIRETPESKVPVSPLEIFGLVAMPIVGYGAMFFFKEEVELLDWRYISSIWIMTGVSIVFYFLSRTLKFSSGPLFMALVPSVLATGVVLSILQLIHFAPVASMAAMVMATPVFIIFAILVLPIFALVQAIILFSAEIYNILRLGREKVKSSKRSNTLTAAFARFYFGKNYLLAQVITFPIFITAAQFTFFVLTQEPDSFVQAFVESKDGVFSQGRCEECVTATEYVCTIAAFGSEKLVKPIHIGIRNGSEIRVNRQLKVCNAFEEILAEKAPKVQAALRRGYDGLQIRVERWKNVRFVTNSLYILIKPMEWAFLLYIYLTEPNPERRIGRQYVPLEIAGH